MKRFNNYFIVTSVITVGAIISAITASKVITGEVTVTALIIGILLSVIAAGSINANSITSAIVVGVITSAVVMSLPVQAQEQCLNVPVTYAVTRIEPRFIDQNGSACRPRIDKNVQCYLRGYTHYYEINGRRHSIFSSVKKSSITLVQRECFRR